MMRQKGDFWEKDTFIQSLMKRVREGGSKKKERGAARRLKSQGKFVAQFPRKIPALITAVPYRFQIGAGIKIWRGWQGKMVRQTTLRE